ncbi:outer membrane lipoprotein chaperone LolA [Ferrimonas balearica]|uniref:outer membrane lipoprotein chaperone LolA n=1 Tax=Ferrimonas balearica TaxID=44012 RepID=UPI001C9925D5|nr:outer membrane lipoprotein chaperone LolA [Ferrimonas balearica]MBY5920336.1 outer membrane lipoprotein chaperone LolA [Ferrimonas balearica]MBY5996979.1 outer membrane lipoprotein chaperone LolA [Ferrimonas balearica]
MINRWILSMAVAVAAPMAMAAPQQALKAKLATVPAFEAEFSQVVTESDGTVLQEGQGTLAMAVPNRFAWHQNSPEESVILSDGKDVYLYDPMLEQVSIYALTDATGQTPLSLLSSDDEEAWEAYQITQQGECFTLTPNEAETIQSMAICFDGDAIEKLSLVDGQQVTTTMDLSQFRNGPLDDGRFHFAPPEGTLVDDQRNP